MLEGELDLGLPRKDTKRVSLAASLITQGKHKFYTLTMQSNILAETCSVDTRVANPISGFQRLLDEKRAKEIAEYIDNDFGTIPGSIVLSAQPSAELQYNNVKKTLSFIRTQGAFLILDGQHRVYGFKLATTALRVPVVIYNNLDRSEEARLFIDINTKQRPVPSELLLDIKRLAESESTHESLFHDIFDFFAKETDSPLFGLMSPNQRSSGKISRTTFYPALKAIIDTIEDSDAKNTYTILKNYIHVWKSHLRTVEAEENITNPTLLRAVITFFPLVAERVASLYDRNYSVENFDNVLRPFFLRVKKADLQKPGIGIKKAIIP